MKNEKTTYTRGPWRIGDAGRTVFGAPNGNPSPETVARGLSRANARLIAVAPELLEAARHAVALLERLDYDAPGRAELAAAIARAEGE